MQNITFDFLGQHRHGMAFHEYLRLRKTFFVDELDWDIPHNDEVEMDQYDNPCAYYSLVLRRGQVVGGARVMPTTSTWGQHTYMLRDAMRGSIATIPRTAMPSDIETDEVWECTRLVVSDVLTNPSDRATCLSMVVSGLVDVAYARGARELVTLTRPSLVRALRSLGFPADQMGQTYQSDADGRKYAMLRMPAMQSSHLMAAE